VQWTDFDLCSSVNANSDEYNRMRTPPMSMGRDQSRRSETLQGILLVQDGIAIAAKLIAAQFPPYDQVIRATTRRSSRSSKQDAMFSAAPT